MRALFHVKQSIRRLGPRGLLVLAALLLSTLAPSRPTVQAENAAFSRATDAHVPGAVLVKRKPGIELDRLRAIANPRAIQTISRPSFDVLTVPPGQEVAIATRLQRSGIVEYAEPDHLRYIQDITPDDPNYAQQWSLPQINAPAAWQTTTGSDTVTIAVIDTGFDFTHPDRPAHLIAGPTRISTSENCPPPSNGLPQDDNGHGTHVSGIIAARFNNETGIAGLAPGVRLLVIKAGDCHGTFSDSDVIQAIADATQQGAKVINMSFGAPDPGDALHSALQDAWSHGVVLVAAAGNDANGPPYYPAADPNVIAVSATDSADHLASFSPRWTGIDLAAPGVDILSTVPLGSVQAGASPYDKRSGTSMAAPHVSAVAGLLFSARGDITNAQVVRAVEEGAQVVQCSNPDPGYGHGRLNALGALQAAGLANATRAASAITKPLSRIYLPLVSRSCQ